MPQVTVPLSTLCPFRCITTRPHAHLGFSANKRARECCARPLQLLAPKASLETIILGVQKVMKNASGDPLKLMHGGGARLLLAGAATARTPLRRCHLGHKPEPPAQLSRLQPSNYNLIIYSIVCSLEDSDSLACEIVELL